VSVTILVGDCREVMADQGPFDLIIADPPYGDTSLSWDKMVRGWEKVARARLKPTGSMWVFGSLRFFMLAHRPIRAAGLRVAQEIVWEKHNGSSFHADRFKRVHELAVQLVRDDAAWAGVYNEVQKTADATARTVRRKGRPAHTGNIGTSHYVSEDGGPRIMRSVIYERSCHGRAIHPTQKPVTLLETLIRTSCPPGGLVGDFFAGSGAAGEAAMMTGRRYVGCEIDPDYHAAASARLAQMLPLGAAA
jgi:site-specific DNA-methyltransferase (adenine-specific)